jgi:hypothetical protein
MGFSSDRADFPNQLEKSLSEITPSNFFAWFSTG